MATDDTMACAPIAYPSTQPGLISLSEKEVVKVKEFHHDGFYLVEATSERKTGWVAKSAVRLAVVHRATHAFAETEEPDELPLAENDVVYQLLEPDEEWAYGLVKSQGTSYLTMHDIESPPYLSLSLSLSRRTVAGSVGPLMRTGFFPMNHVEIVAEQPAPPPISNAPSPPKVKPHFFSHV